MMVRYPGKSARTDGALLAGAVTAMLVVSGGIAAAQEFDCAEPVTQVEMTSCAGLDYEQADRELNRLWPEILAVAKSRDEYVGELATSMDVPTTVEALRAAQRAWITFRDAQCEYEAYEVFGGTAQPMVGSLCLARLTRERTELLSRALEER